MNLFDLNTQEINSVDESLPLWSIKVGDYQYILYTTNKALVFKGENKEPVYEITSLGCTCPGDRYSSNACKHRKVISFIGDGSAVPPIEGTAVKAKHPINTVSNKSDLLDGGFEALFE